MKGFWLPLSFVLFLSVPVISQDNDAIKYASTINTSELKEYLEVIAADSMEGRLTGERGQKKAGRYIAENFKISEVPPGFITDTGSSYFQQFNLYKKTWEESYIKIKGKRKDFLKDFYIIGSPDFSNETEVEAKFLGYGIDEKNYSDYEGADVRNKAVVVFMGEPKDKNEESRITNNKEKYQLADSWQKKAMIAKEKGARAIFLVKASTDEGFQQDLNLHRCFLEQAAISVAASKNVVTSNVFFIPPSLAAEIFNMSTEDFLNLRKKTGEKGVAGYKKVKSSRITIKASRKEILFSTENVLGFIEGSDKKDEVVIVTAHYDHEGIKCGQIYNGADDDGSGTVAIMEIAEAFALAKKEGKGPRRSLLFMAVTAEEKGLLGSAYYVENPVFPLSNTVANLNIDMIGRLDHAHEKNENYVYLIGSDKLSSRLHSISEEVNKSYTQLQIDYTYNNENDPNKFYYRSDHYNFAKNNIPVIFYFTGVHDDYHMPTDDIDKILFHKVEKIARLVFHTAWELANMEQKIEADKVSKERD